MRMLDPLRRVPTHEELFVDRYDALLRAALRVTEGDRQAAEDLVQDAFIRFTMVQPPLDEVKQLDSYFYAMLRNMHTSRVRRGRVAEVSLSILDFDSLDIGLEALDALSRTEVRQTLRTACDYGCLRRHSSKVGSIFLLRFFHGYLPSEIAQIARLSTAIVDDRVFHARREAKLFVNNPGQLAFIGAGAAAASSSPSTATATATIEIDDESDEGLMQQLRARIFSERHVPCWSRQALRALYGADRNESLTREELAALVSCPTCLDEVNAMLKMSALASRWPTDTLGPGARGGGGSGAAGGARSSSRLASARRRASAVFEHRPHELRVLVNGFTLGSRTVGSEPSDLVLTVNVGEPVALVELLSEQGLCLAFLDVHPPPDGPARQRRRVELSDGRHAELDVIFSGPWPTIRATYVDPRTVAVEPETADDLQPLERASTVAALTRPWRFRFRFRCSPALIMAGALLIWLLFWTPGVEVSAAARIANAIKWLVTELVGSPARTAPPESRRAIPPAVDPSMTSTASMRAGASAAVRTTKPLTASRRTALELKALAQLQRVDAYLGQEVFFGPTNDTRVDLRGTVDGAARKQALDQALASLVRTHDLHADIADVRHIARSTSTRGRLAAPPETPTAEEFVFVRDQFPMFEPLRQYFRYQHEYAGPAIDEAEIDAEARRFALGLLAHARGASQHAWALKHLADRFAPDAIRAASEETQEQWQTVIREHSRSYAHEMALLRAALEPVATASGLLDSDLPPTVQTGAPDGWSRIVRLWETQQTLDAAIQAAFMIHTNNPAAPQIQTRAFWRTLKESETLAAAIAGAPLSP